MSNTELKPCPFCGVEAKISSYDWGYSIKEYRIYCNSCDCASGRYHSKEKAINAWNTRKPMDRIVEQLETAESVKVFGSLNSGNRLIPVQDAIDIVKAGGVE